MSRRLRQWLVSLAATAIVATPLVVTQLTDTQAGATSGVDTIQYVEQTGASHTYVSYIPGDGSAPTNQSVTGGGGCATPTVSGPPLLAFSALYYGKNVGGVAYTGPSSAAIVGAYNGRTGVCAVSPAWSVERNESLIFAVGPNSLTTGRLWVEAALQIQRQDKQSGGSSETVTLLERNGATLVGTQSFVITGGSGTQITADTGVIPGGFDTVEVRVNGNSTACKAPSISIVGPNSTFSFGKLAQTISFTNTPPTAPSVGATYTATATATSGLPVTLSLDGLSIGCTLNAATGLVSLVGPAGACTVDANQGGSAHYQPAPQVQQSVTSSKAGQSVSFTSSPPTDAIVGDTYTPTATSTSGLPVTFSIDSTSTSGCTIDSGTGVVTFTAPAGDCTIDGNQAGNGNYAPAPQVQQDVTVSQTICGQQTITAQSTDGTEQSGEINASITFLEYNGLPAPSSVCKTYKSFTATTNDPTFGQQQIDFESTPLATAHLTATFSWAIQSFCTPDGVGGPICPPTLVSFDGGATYVPQTYCSSAQAAGLQWCTTSRTYSYPGTGTRIDETWDGYGDPIFRHP